ncbi:MAG: TIGR03936 family radical SAM-associated protein [Chloroflexota bacterium]
MMRITVIQRVRVSFGVSGPLIYLSVLDMGRLWERLLRRAQVPLAYTQGYSPHPRMHFAAALPVGYGSSCELLDLLLAEALTPDTLLAAAAPHCPPGLTLRGATEVPVRAPLPQALMRAAHYRVDLQAAESPAQLEAAIGALLARESIPRERRRKREQATPYDLRPLIHTIAALGGDDGHPILEMVLRCGSQGAGRPEEILAELGLASAPYHICRTRLVWEPEEEYRP